MVWHKPRIRINFQTEYKKFNSSLNGACFLDHMVNICHMYITKTIQCTLTNGHFDYRFCCFTSNKQILILFFCFESPQEYTRNENIWKTLIKRIQIENTKKTFHAAFYLRYYIFCHDRIQIYMKQVAVTYTYRLYVCFIRSSSRMLFMCWTKERTLKLTV